MSTPSPAGLLRIKYVNCLKGPTTETASFLSVFRKLTAVAPSLVPLTACQNQGWTHSPSLGTVFIPEFSCEEI